MIKNSNKQVTIFEKFCFRKDIIDFCGNTLFITDKSFTLGESNMDKIEYQNEHIIGCILE